MNWTEQEEKQLESWVGTASDWQPEKASRAGLKFTACRRGPSMDPACREGLIGPSTAVDPRLLN